MIGFLIPFGLCAQNNNPSQIFHYDTSNQIKELKQKIKDLKNSIVRDEELIQSKEYLVDSLEWVEKKKIRNTLNPITSETHFEFDNFFTSRSVSQGRLSGLDGPSFYPSLTYKHKNGFYANTTVYKYTDPDIIAAIPQFDISLGYGRIFWEALYLDAGYSRSFVLYGTKKSRVLMINAISFSSSYDFDLVSVNADFSYYWSDIAKQNPQTQSSQLSLYIDKYFQFYHFLGSYKLTIDPTVKLVFGSDNTFQIIRQIVKQEKELVKKKVPKEAVVQSIFWGLLAVDFSCPIKYRMKNIDIYITPRFVIPYNVLDENDKSLNPSRTKIGDPVFYFTGGINYRFRFWK